MKKKLLVFALPLLALGVTACGQPSSSSAPSSSGGGSSSASSSQAPSSSSTAPSSSSAAPSYSGDLPDYDPSEVRDSLVIHYHRDDAKYDNWALWIWDHGNGGEGAEYLPTAVDSYGSVWNYPLSTWSPGNWSKLDLGVIVKSKGSWNAKDPDGDRYIITSDLTLDENGNYSVWLWTGITAIYKTEVEYPYFVSRAYFKSFRKLSVLSGNGLMSEVKLYKDGELLQSFGPFDKPKRSFEAELTEDADMAHGYSIVAKYENGFEIDQPVDISPLYESEDFASQYHYDGDDLGAVYSEAKTTFKVWSPFSESISLRVYDSGTPVSLDEEKGDDNYREVAMVKGEKGVWSATVDGDLAGKYYTYVVTNYKFTAKEIVDPYAKSAGINGVRGMIVDFSKTNPVGWDSFDKAIQVDPKALTVYETHVADLTAHESWTGREGVRGKFLGAAQEGTRYNETVTTGFDHIKELGVNAVQLQPIFDQANDERPDKYKFNWGYNPLNYNVLEGAYSTDPYDGYVRIREFKTLVKAYYDAGINVIMDVVYNHVNSVDGLQFDVLVPGYYFRYNSMGGLSNGSGCGNETASDHYMFHKYMVDSTLFWAKEYKLGGFRFDLMALHDLDTMADLSAKLHRINPTLAVYGEPWTGGGTTLDTSKQASQANGMKYVGYAQFNDNMRDGLVRSGMKPVSEAGFGFNKWGKAGGADLVSVQNGLRGFTASTVTDANKTLNYVSCHDNYTINDRILAYEIAKKLEGDDLTTRAERAKMNLFAQSFALTSQGISFFLAGEEMLRSKFELTDESKTISERMDYAHNSYNSDGLFDGGVVNALDYSRKVEFGELFENYKALVNLKKTLPGLRQDVHKIGSDDTSSLVKVTYGAANNQVINEFNSGNDSYKIVYNGGFGELANVDLSGYQMVFDSAKRDIALTASTPMEAFEVLIAKKTA